MSKSLLVVLGLGCCLAVLLQQMASAPADVSPRSRPRISAAHGVARPASPPRSRPRLSAFEPRGGDLRSPDEGASPPRPGSTSVLLLRERLLKRLAVQGDSLREISKPAPAALAPPTDLLLTRAEVPAAACPAQPACASRSRSTAGRDPPLA